MGHRLNLIFFILVAELICFWPVWRWYYLRVVNSPDELTGLLSIITALFLIWFKRNNIPVNRKFPLSRIIALNFIYILSYFFAPPLIRAIIAFTAVAFTLTGFFSQNSLNIGIWGLFILGVPLIPTLQFYLGFPLRWLTAFIAVPLINLSGFLVSQNGTCLNWSGNIIAIDAPCSGVKMLWTGLYLLLTFIAIYDFKISKLITALFGAIIIIIFGNILRSTTLFYLEAGIINTAEWLHQAVGLVSFILVGIFILFLTLKLKGEKNCNDITFS